MSLPPFPYLSKHTYTSDLSTSAPTPDKPGQAAIPAVLNDSKVSSPSPLTEKPDSEGTDAAKSSQFGDQYQLPLHAEPDPEDLINLERPFTNFAPTTTTKGMPLIPFNGYHFVDKHQTRSDGTRVFVCNMARKVNKSRNPTGKCTASLYLTANLAAITRVTGRHRHDPAPPSKPSKRKMKKALNKLAD